MGAEGLELHLWNLGQGIARCWITAILSETQIVAASGRSSHYSKKITRMLFGIPTLPTLRVAGHPSSLSNVQRPLSPSVSEPTVNTAVQTARTPWRTRGGPSSALGRPQTCPRRPRSGAQSWVCRAFASKPLGNNDDAAAIEALLRCPQVGEVNQTSC